MIQKIVITVEVQEQEEPFSWIHWLAAQPPHPLLSSQNYTLRISQECLGPNARNRRQQNLEVVHRVPPKLTYLPGTGLHFVWYKRHLVWVVRGNKPQQEATIQNPFVQRREPTGVLVLSVLGRQKAVMDTSFKKLWTTV